MEICSPMWLQPVQVECYAGHKADETPRRFCGEGPWLEVGVGICTGEEYVGNVGGGGFKDFTAIGDITNTAARLQASAAGGEIVMCGTTYAAMAGAYGTIDPRDLQLKGRRAARAGLDQAV